jgi:hypothetical protein
MDERGRTLLTACGLTLLPVASAIPLFQYVETDSWLNAHSTGWLLCLLALFATGCEFKVLLVIENKFSSKKDVFWYLRIAFGLMSALVLVVSAHAFVVIGVPGLIFGDIPTLFARLRRL